ncbi:unnamed protein product [Mesocestoides corti]|uniref:Uncharacterized protein n=1 Tax=Mesocestoides corti TaxID=53468 RepID=A0A0R3UC54_MESCO|nr:unnamed protein product [Mesocestoides corti]
MDARSISSPSLIIHVIVNHSTDINACLQDPTINATFSHFLLTVIEAHGLHKEAFDFSEYTKLGRFIQLMLRFVRQGHSDVLELLATLSGSIIETSFRLQVPKTTLLSKEFFETSQFVSPFLANLLGRYISITACLGDPILHRYQLSSTSVYNGDARAQELAVHVFSCLFNYSPITLKQASNEEPLPRFSSPPHFLSEHSYQLLVAACHWLRYVSGSDRFTCSPKIGEIWLTYLKQIQNAALAFKPDDTTLNFNICVSCLHLLSLRHRSSVSSPMSAEHTFMDELSRLSIQLAEKDYRLAVEHSPIVNTCDHLKLFQELLSALAPDCIHFIRDTLVPDSSQDSIPPKSSIRSVNTRLNEAGIRAWCFLADRLARLTSLHKRVVELPKPGTESVGIPDTPTSDLFTMVAFCLAPLFLAGNSTCSLSVCHF